jgi:Cytochrome C and Quinol oxidase polypeptide I
MVLFIASEVMFFGGLFGAYFTIRAAATVWPPEGSPEYPPLSLQSCTGAGGGGIGADLWIIGLLLVSTSSILGAVNFITTIFNMRAPGMTRFRMPMFVWTMLVTSLLVLLATPVFTSALVLLLIDRNLGGSFFDPAKGGIAIMWQNIFWFYSHPAVYVMVLPGMGIVSERCAQRPPQPGEARRRDHRVPAELLRPHAGRHQRGRRERPLPGLLATGRRAGHRRQQRHGAGARSGRAAPGRGARAAAGGPGGSAAGR